MSLQRFLEQRAQFILLDLPLQDLSCKRSQRAACACADDTTSSPTHNTPPMPSRPGRAHGRACAGTLGALPHRRLAQPALPSRAPWWEKSAIRPDLEHLERNAPLGGRAQPRAGRTKTHAPGMPAMKLASMVGLRRFTSSMASSPTVPVLCTWIGGNRGLLVCTYICPWVVPIRMPVLVLVFFPFLGFR